MFATYGIPVLGTCTGGGYTASANPAIYALVPPAPANNYGLRKSSLFTRLMDLSYVSAGTQHTLTILKEIGRTTVASAAAASQAVVNLTANPGTSLLGPAGTASQLANDGVAANDYLVFELPDGTYYFDYVASVNVLAVTMTNNLPTNGLAAGATVWMMGQTTDSEPTTGLAFPFLKPPVSARTLYTNILGIAVSGYRYSPLLVSSSNATAAGFIEYMTALYTDR